MGGGRPQPMSAQVLDVGKRPEIKNALLSGRMTNLTAPFMYHDPAKELETVAVNQWDEGEQRIVNDLTVGEYSITVTSQPHNCQPIRKEDFNS